MLRLMFDDWLDVDRTLHQDEKRRLEIQLNDMEEEKEEFESQCEIAEERVRKLMVS